MCVNMGAEFPQSFSSVGPRESNQTGANEKRPTSSSSRKTRHGQKFEVEVSQINIDLLISCNNTHACE